MEAEQGTEASTRSLRRRRSKAEVYMKRGRPGRRSGGGEEESLSGNFTSEPAMPRASSSSADTPDQAMLGEDEDDEFVAPSGLSSRKRMHDSYRIMNKNDVERQGGNQDSYVTVRDFHPLLLLLTRGMGEDGEGGQGRGLRFRVG